jgi:hypothetical protein
MYRPRSVRVRVSRQTTSAARTPSTSNHRDRRRTCGRAEPSERRRVAVGDGIDHGLHHRAVRDIRASGAAERGDEEKR